MEMDRRFFTRIEVPGTKIQYKKVGSTKLFTALSKPGELKNISKSGLAFFAMEQLQSGDRLLLKVQFPDGKKLRLLGRIRWQDEYDDIEKFEVGVQFAPFGTRSEYNSLKDWDYLKSLKGLDIIKPQEDDTRQSE